MTENSKHTPGRCRPWLGGLDSDGYGLVTYRGRTQRIHRVEYEGVHGAIPEGLTIDHLCRNRRCFNPDHLEAVTNRENILRGEGPTAQNARKSACHAGHPLSGENLEVRPNGTRRCKECGRARWRAYRRRKIAAGEWSRS